MSNLTYRKVPLNVLIASEIYGRDLLQEIKLC